MASFKQINFIKSLATQNGYSSAREAAVAYGFDATVSLEFISASEASGLIDWLKGSAKTAPATNSSEDKFFAKYPHLRS